jgi:hypothetical protein
VKVDVDALVVIGGGKLVLMGSWVEGDADGTAVAELLHAARIKQAAMGKNKATVADFMPVGNLRVPGWISGRFFRV